MTNKRNTIEQELEWERVKHRQQKESKEHWKSKAEQATADIDEWNDLIEQWKALYIEQLNRANRFEELHNRMTKRPRDPKTGRIISKSNAVRAEALNLCDEIKQRAVKDVAPTNSLHT